MSKPQIIRSELLRGKTLSNAIKRVEEKYMPSSFTNYQEDSYGYYFLSSMLPILNFYKKVYSASVGVSKGTLANESQLFKLAQLCTGHSQQHTIINWKIDNGTYQDHNNFQLGISAGLSKQGFYLGISAVNDRSPGYKSKVKRAEFFSEILDAVGMSSSVRARMDGDDLIMEAAEPWTLHFPFADIRKRNPFAFHICGFSDIENPFELGQLLNAKLGGSQSEIGLRAYIAADIYESLRPRLSKLWHGYWDGLIYGDLAESAIAILRGEERDLNLNSQIPAFDWYDTEDGPQIIGSVVAEGKKRHLELAVEDSIQGSLIDRVSFLEEITFDRIL